LAVGSGLGCGFCCCSGMVDLLERLEHG